MDVLVLEPWKGVRRKVNVEVKKIKTWDFPNGPMVKDPPGNAGDAGWTPGLGTKTPHATEQLSPCAPTTEPSFLEPCSSKEATATKPELHS